MVRVDLVTLAERRRLVEHELELEDVRRFRNMKRRRCKRPGCRARLRFDNESGFCKLHRDRNRWRYEATARRVSGARGV